MTQVYFVGAGPGDPELLTLKAARLIASADTLVYAGSLVSPEIIALAKPGARLVDSAPLSLQETHAALLDCLSSGGLAVRLHSGDPGLYGAVPEQARLLREAKVEYEIVPGVTSASAAAAALAASFTLPERTQTLILTRLPGRTPMPRREQLRDLAAHGSAIAVYLSSEMPEKVQDELLAAGLGPDTKIALAHRVSWPDQKLFTCQLKDLASCARENNLTRQTLFLVLPSLEEAENQAVSKLYDKDFAHGFRKA